MSDIKLKKPHLVHKRFQLPKGCSISSFVMREIDGEDEREAGRFISALNEVDNPGLVIMEEQMKVALVAVNGKNIEHPYSGMSAWSTKTRRFIMEAFGVLNGVEDDEVAVFLGASTDLTSEQAEAEEIDEKELAEVKNKAD